MINLHVPSGIGDVSWMYSKLCHVPGMMNWVISEGWPARTAPFLKLLEGVHDARYDKFKYDDIIKFESHHGYNDHNATWAKISALGFNNIYLECNQHLEAGKRLEDWLPDLPTQFHYPIRICGEDKERAEKLLANLPKPIWGISAASYRGSEAWKTWGFDEWKFFLRKWADLAGGTILLMGGFWDDLTHTLASEESYVDIVGKTNVPSMIHVLNQLDGYIGFSSGMGILRTVLNKPVFMLWPDHQVELSTSWAPQHMLDDGSYIASLWRDPRLIFERAKIWYRGNYECSIGKQSQTSSELLSALPVVRTW